jgi:hypothetical protein
MMLRCFVDFQNVKMMIYVDTNFRHQNSDIIKCLNLTNTILACGWLSPNPLGGFYEGVIKMNHFQYFFYFLTFDIWISALKRSEETVTI